MALGKNLGYGSNISARTNYLLHEENGLQFCLNMAADPNDLDEIIDEMEDVASLKPNLKTNNLHIVYSFPDHSLDQDTRNEATIRVNEKLGLAGFPTLIAPHVKGAHPHNHCLFTRNDREGNVFNDSFLHFRMARAVNEVCKEMGIEMTNNCDENGYRIDKDKPHQAPDYQHKRVEDGVDETTPHDDLVSIVNKVGAANKGGSMLDFVKGMTAAGVGVEAKFTGKNIGLSFSYRDYSTAANKVYGHQSALKKKHDITFDVKRDGAKITDHVKGHGGKVEWTESATKHAAGTADFKPKGSARKSAKPKFNKSNAGKKSPMGAAISAASFSMSSNTSNSVISNTEIGHEHETAFDFMKRFERLLATHKRQIEEQSAALRSPDIDTSSDSVAAIFSDYAHTNYSYQRPYKYPRYSSLNSKWALKSKSAEARKKVLEKAEKAQEALDKMKVGSKGHDFVISEIELKEGETLEDYLQNYNTEKSIDVEETQSNNKVREPVAEISEPINEIPKFDINSVKKDVAKPTLIETLSEGAKSLAGEAIEMADVSVGWLSEKAQKGAEAAAAYNAKRTKEQRQFYAIFKTNIDADTVDGWKMWTNQKTGEQVFEVDKVKLFANDDYIRTKHKFKDDKEMKKSINRMLSIAHKKGWDLENLEITGSDKFVKMAKHQAKLIVARLEQQKAAEANSITSIVNNEANELVAMDNKVVSNDVPDEPNKEPELPKEPPAYMSDVLKHSLVYFDPNFVMPEDLCKPRLIGRPAKGYDREDQFLEVNRRELYTFISHKEIRYAAYILSQSSPEDVLKKIERRASASEDYRVDKKNIKNQDNIAFSSPTEWIAYKKPNTTIDIVVTDLHQKIEAEPHKNAKSILDKALKDYPKSVRPYLASHFTFDGSGGKLLQRMYHLSTTQSGKQADLGMGS